MAERSRRSKTTYERIKDAQKKIISTEERLTQLKQELDSLYTILFEETARQQNAEMKKLFDIIGEKHISIKDVINLLEK